ncbi:MAG TPA: hypothetical protein VFM85_05235 [Actinomycetota bacterium]|nr:hypothetical protein [Actinomycetota bacterium]
MEFFAILGLIPLVLLGLVVLGVLALAGRGEPDPTGGRTYALYLFAVTFISLFITLFALIGVVQAVVRIPLSDAGGEVPVAIGSSGAGYGSVGGSEGLTTPVPGFETHSAVAQYQSFDPDRDLWRMAVQAALIALAAGIVLRLHTSWARELLNEPGVEGSPAWRTYQAYVHAVCFVSVLIALVAGAAAAYGLFRLIAPGVTAQFSSSTAERQGGIAQFVTGGLSVLASYAVFAYHWRRSARGSPRASTG